MKTIPDFPLLDSPAKCAALWAKYPEKVVGMWATGTPRQNVDVLWRLRQELLKIGVPVVFFFNDSAKTMLEILLSKEENPTLSGDDQHIYQIDEAKFFRQLSFVEVLVTNDYLYQMHCTYAREIGAKLVGLQHHANLAHPYFANYHFDYFVGDKGKLAAFDYNFFPDSCKIHRNSHFTQLVAGHPKIDLIAEERQRNVSCGTIPPILLIYPSHVSYSCTIQSINPDKYEEIQSNMVNAFLSWCPQGIVVYRPMGKVHPVEKRLNDRFADDGRFFLDEEDDNKFWLARSRYFITDCSMGFVNFCMTARRPAIRMMYRAEGGEPRRDDWGWTMSRPEQLIPLLAEMDAMEHFWDKALHEKQKREMPTLGTNFSLLAGMIKRIFSNDDDAAWPRMDKGHTPCETPRDLLKLVARCTRKSGYGVLRLGMWIEDVLKTAPSHAHNPNIWLFLIRRALLNDNERDSEAARVQLQYEHDSPAQIAHNIDLWLDAALANLPFTQSIGLLRYCLRKDPAMSAKMLLMTLTSNVVSGPHKKRMLFLLGMEWRIYDQQVMMAINDLAETMPQHFSRPVLDKLNRFLPLAMKVPLSLRRFAACILGIKKPLAKNYWQAHRKLA